MVSRIVFPSVAQRANRLPGRAASLRVEARGGLVEEDQLGIADQGEPEIEPAQLPAGELAAANVGAIAQPREVEHLVHGAGGGVEAGPVRERLARCDVAVDPARLEHYPDPPAQRDLSARGIVAEHGDLALGARTVPLEDLDRRGLARAVRPEQAEDLAAVDRHVDPTQRLEVAVALAQPADLDRGSGCYQCTPRVSVAIAICSKETCSSTSFWPFAAAESGNTR